MRSEDIVETIKEATNSGELRGATHVGRSGTKGDGPYMTFWLLVQEGIVIRATTDSHGCSYAIATSNVLAGHIQGMQLADLPALSRKAILSLVGGLPEGKEYCADLAFDALHSLEPVAVPE